MMYEMIRNILEAMGVVESKQSLVKKKLGLASQIKPRGPVTLIVHKLGSKPVSAMSAVRQLTGLDLDEIAELARMLPLPLLRNVSPEFAQQAQELLEVMGVEVELTGLPFRQQESISSSKISEEEPSAAATPAATVPLPPGDFVVRLMDMGLLEERVIEGICRLTGASPEEIIALTRQLPQPILVGVDEETAQRVQRDLQMVAAVVDIERTTEPETKMNGFDEAAPESASTDEPAEAAGGDDPS